MAWNSHWGEEGRRGRRPFSLPLFFQPSARSKQDGCVYADTGNQGNKGKEMGVLSPPKYKARMADVKKPP